MTDTGSETAFVAIGGNLGNLRETFAGAVAALAATHGIEVSGASPLYDTSPVGGPAEQPQFLNGVVALRTSLTALALLRRLLAIEAQFARERAVRWGPRTLDLDLLVFGNQVIDQAPELVVPHPRLAERAFVLVPLAALAPDGILPGQRQTFASLAAALPGHDREDVRLVTDNWI